MKKKSGTWMYDEELLNTILAVFEEVVNNLKENQNNDSLFYDSTDMKRFLNISESTLFRIIIRRFFLKFIFKSLLNTSHFVVLLRYLCFKNNNSRLTIL